MANESNKPLSRGEFLKRTGQAAATAAIAGSIIDCGKESSGINEPIQAKSSGKGPATVPGGVQRYNQLGKLPYYVSDVGFGAGDLMDPNVALYAIDKGINYFDTAPDYADSEETLGKALYARRKDRSKLVITTKMCRPVGYPGHLNYKTTKKRLIKGVEDSLKRMRTDYVDFMMVHALSENKGRNGSWKQRLTNPGVLEAMQTLKAQGKVKYFGFSEHSGANLADSIALARKNGFSLVMPASYTWRKNQGDVFAAMKEATNKSGMGFVSMKVLKLRKEGVKAVLNAGQTPSQLDEACIKYVNDQGPISSAILTCSTKTKIDRFLKASGKQLSSLDRQILDTYDRAMVMSAEKNCDFTCAAPCESQCPGDVQVQAIMRHHMYDDVYKSRRFARMHYNELLANEQASACASCHAPCANVCPEGLDIKDLMSSTHQRLTIG